MISNLLTSIHGNTVQIRRDARHSFEVVTKAENSGRQPNRTLFASCIEKFIRILAMVLAVLSQLHLSHNEDEEQNTGQEAE